MATAGKGRPFQVQDQVRKAAYQNGLSRSRPAPQTRAKNRHGRGARGPLLHPVLPGWTTREESFAALVDEVVAQFQAACEEVQAIEYGVEDVPPSPPAEWEDRSVSLSRAFPRDWKRGLSPRVVLYRLPIERATRLRDRQSLVVALLAERTAELLRISPEDLFLR